MFTFHGCPAPRKYFNDKHFPIYGSSFCSHLDGKCGLVDGELQLSEIGIGHGHAQANEVIIRKLMVQNLVLPQRKFAQARP